MAKHCLNIQLGVCELYVKYDPGEHPELQVYYQGTNVTALLLNCSTANGVPVLQYIRNQCKEMCDE